MRRRITTIAVGIVTVVLLSLAIVAVLAVRGELYENLDRSLDQRAADVAASFAVGEQPVLLTSDTEDHFALVLDEEGAVVASTENAVGLDVTWPLPTAGATIVEQTDLPIEDDAYRIVVRSDEIGGRVGFVVVGENIDDLRDTVRELVVVLAVVVPLALVALAAAVWWLVGRTLRPVDLIRRRVDEIGLADLERRVPVPGTGDEVDELATTMNRMLERLQASAERQRNFVSDASHELRTPLTRLRTALEVELAHPSDDAVSATRAALGDVVEMQHLVDDLLFLARVDAGRTGVRSEVVDLDVVVADEVVAAASGATVVVDTVGVRPVQTVGDANQLARVVRNLLTNALRFAESRVRVELSERDGRAELTVSDDGPGIAPADRTRVFERFVRLDPARSGRDGGSGLGLAIVAEIVATHHGTVAIEPSETGGASVVVSLRLPDTP